MKLKVGNIVRVEGLNGFTRGRGRIISISDGVAMVKFFPRHRSPVKVPLSMCKLWKAANEANRLAVDNRRRNNVLVSPHGKG